MVLTIEFTEQGEAELDRVAARLKRTRSQTLSAGLTLLRIYLQAEDDGKYLIISSPLNYYAEKIITIPEAKP